MKAILILAGALVGCFIIALGSAAIISHLCSNSLLPADISAIVCNQIKHKEWAAAAGSC